MSLTRKTLLVLCLSTALSLTVLMAVAKTELFDTFNTIETDHYGHVAASVARTIYEQNRRTEAFALDWAVWDDAYLFLQNNGQRFLASNFDMEVINIQNLRFIAYLDTRFTPVAVLERPAEAALNEAVLRSVIEQQPFIRSILGKDALTFLIPVAAEQTYAFVTLAEVTKTVRTGESNGFFMAVRLIDDEFLNAVSTISGISLSFTDGTIPNNLNFMTLPNLGYQIHYAIRPGKGSYLQTVMQISDVGGNADLTLSYLSERTFHATIVQSITKLGLLVTLCMAASTLITILILQRLVLSRLQATIRKFRLIGESGDVTLRVPVEGTGEVRELGETINTTLDRIERFHYDLKNLSMIDGLTGIANRRQFDERLTHEFRRAAREKRHLSVMMVDIDFFKFYNDTYGHQKGDVCLKEIAETLSKVLWRPADTIARYGGEEFVLILPETTPDGAVHIAERLLSAVSSIRMPHETSPLFPYITVSVGIRSEVPHMDDSPSDMVKKADAALYEAKKGGRNRYSIG